jgi:chromosome segregation ATPase
VPYRRRPTPPPPPSPPTPPARPVITEPDTGPQKVIDFWSEDTHKIEVIERQYTIQQQNLLQQQQMWQQQQMQLRMQQQREFEEQQRLQAERERLAQEQFMREQMQRQSQGRVLELERELLTLKNQHDRDQMLLEQYNTKIKALEQEMSQLNLNINARDANKDALIKSLQEQVAMWKSKYEQLAKLYQQLRQEHLDLLGKHKQAQQKVKDASEALEKLEKMQNEIRNKNLQLADMIRERDRIKADLARQKGAQEEEMERLKRELALSNARVNELSKTKSAEMGEMVAKFNAEKEQLESLLTVRI